MTCLKRHKHLIGCMQFPFLSVFLSLNTCYYHYYLNLDVFFFHLLATMQTSLFSNDGTPNGNHHGDSMRKPMGTPWGHGGHMDPMATPWQPHGTPMETPWKHHGHPMETTWTPHGITMGTPWGTPMGNPMGPPWKHHGKPMETLGTP